MLYVYLCVVEILWECINLIYPKLLGLITLFEVELVGEELALNELDTLTGILDIRLLNRLQYV